MVRKTDCRFNRIRLYRLLLVLFISHWIAACAASTDRRHPEFGNRIEPIKVLCLLPADILVYQELPDGRYIHRRDLSQVAHEEFKRAIVDELTDREYRVLTIPDSDLSRGPELQEIISLYRAVNKSIQLHTFGPDIFPTKKMHFVYSVGSLNSLRESNDADAFVFARVLHRVSDQQTSSYVSLGLADGSGTIIWYGANGFRESAAESHFDSALFLVKKILIDFPEGKL